MERRSFLALLASAPIAALAPWPKVLPQYCFVTETISFEEFTARYIQPAVEYSVRESERRAAEAWRSTGGYTPLPLRLDLADPAHVDLDRLLRLSEHLQQQN